VEAADVVVCGTGGAGAVQLAGEGVVQHLVDERRLPRPAHAGDRDERPERQVDVHVPQVVLAGAEDTEDGPVRGERLHVGGGRLRVRRVALHAAVGRHRDGELAREVLAGERVLRLEDLFRGAGGGNLTPAVAGPGTEVEEVVGRR